MLDRKGIREIRDIPRILGKLGSKSTLVRSARRLSDWGGIGARGLLMGLG